jgi:hypothetical protein
MRLNINISSKAEKILKEPAAAHGKELAAYASQKLEEAAFVIRILDFAIPASGRRYSLCTPSLSHFILTKGDQHG